MWKEIGAGIGLGPNAAKVMQLIGLDKEIGNISSHEPGEHSNIWMRVRKWDTGSLMQNPI
jgi:salicylate hydroxylase